VCCVYERLRRGNLAFKKCAFHACAVTEQRLVEEMGGTNQLNEEEWMLAMMIGQEIWNTGCCYLQSIALNSLDALQLTSQELDNALKRCVWAKLVSLKEDKICLNGYSSGGAFVALRSSLFCQHFHDDIYKACGIPLVEVA
jgi:hypothetical protein